MLWFQLMKTYLINRILNIILMFLQQILHRLCFDSQQIFRIKPINTIYPDLLRGLQFDLRKYNCLLQFLHDNFEYNTICDKQQNNNNFKCFIMWNLISANKITQDRIRQKSMQRHKQSLKIMKPTFKIKQPQKPQFVYAKHKLQMSRRDRLIEIDKHNQILFNKMNHLKTAEYKENKLRPQAQQLKTLNQLIMIQQAEDIYQENKKICQRLTASKTYYPTFKIIGEVQDLEKLNNKSKIARAQSARHLKGRPTSSYSLVSAKLYKSKVTTYDKQGNNSQEKIKIFYKVSQADSRPNSASILKKSTSRPYSSQKHQRHQFELHDKNLYMKEDDNYRHSQQN